MLLWSSGYLVGSIAVESIPPLTFTAWRFGLAAIVLIGLALVTRAPWPRDRGTWARMAVTGLLMQTIQFSAGYVGLSLGVSAGLAALIAGMGPALVVVAAGPFNGERVRPLQWVGALLGAAGVALAVGGRLETAHVGVGLVFLLVSVLGFVVGTLFQKRNGTSVDLRSGAAIQFGAAALAEIPLAALHGGLALPLTGAALGAIAWGGVVNSVMGMMLLFLLLRRGGSGQATSALFLVPAVTALIAMPLLHQPLGAITLAGMAVALAGVWLSGKLGA